MRMIHKLGVIASLIAITLASAGAQEVEMIDTTGTVAVDPVTNRLFIMSTGTLMQPGRVTLSSHELFLIQAGYAPNDIVQFNASAMLIPYYFSAGAKVQVLKPNGLFRGLAVGVDVGAHTGLYGGSRWEEELTGNVAASVGTDDLALHVNALALTDASFSSNRTRVSMQAGASVQLGRTKIGGAALMGEVWMGPQNLEVGAGILGVRAYGKVITWEAALMFMKDNPFNFGGGSTRGLTVFPYASLCVAL
jgi:hypothetical protein